MSMSCALQAINLGGGGGGDVQQHFDDLTI